MSSSLLERVAVGRPLLEGDLAFVPLYLAQPAGSLFSADVEQLKISEVTRAQVGSVEVTNPTSRPVLLPQGYVLSGGWQHRVVVESVLVPAGAKLAVETACVQRGRWGGRTEFEPKGTFAPRKVRKAAIPDPGEFPTSTSWGHPLDGAIGTPTRVTPSRPNRAGGERRRSPRNMQADVWREVEQTLKDLGRQSPSSDLLEAHEQFSASGDRRDQMERIVEAGAQLGQSGVVICRGRRIESFDLFGSDELFRPHWSGIVSSAFLDTSLVADGTVTADKILRFLNRFESKSDRTVASQGLGQLHVVDSSKYAGRILVVDGTLVHASGFRKT